MLTTQAPPIRWVLADHFSRSVPGLGCFKAQGSAYEYKECLPGSSLEGAMSSSPLRFFAVSSAILFAGFFISMVINEMSQQFLLFCLPC